MAIALLPVAMLLFSVAGHPEELFPERAAAGRQAEIFFRQLRADLPRVRLLPALVAEKNYQTAFLNLSEALARDPAARRLCVALESDHFGLLERYRPLADGFHPAGWPGLMERLGVGSPLRLAQLAVHRLVNGFSAGELSGPAAARHWQTLLMLFRLAAARRRPGDGDAGLLLLGAGLDVFKAGPRWRRRAMKLLKRNPTWAADGDLARVLAAWPAPGGGR